MTTEIWIYEGRNSGPRAFWNFADARREQDADNGCTPEEARWDGFDVGGSEEKGYFYIDDGGAITKVTVEGDLAKFSVGNSVRTTDKWSSNYGLTLRGKVISVLKSGPPPVPEANVRVSLDEKSRVSPGLYQVWFRPEYLELDE